MYEKKEVKFTRISSLINAIQSGNLEIFKYLLEKNVNLHEKSCMVFLNAVIHKRLDFIQYLISKFTCTCCILSKHSKAVRYAAQFGAIEIVKYFIKLKVSFASENYYAIRYAYKNKHFEIVKLLLEYTEKDGQKDSKQTIPIEILINVLKDYGYNKFVYLTQNIQLQRYSWWILNAINSEIKSAKRKTTLKYVKLINKNKSQKTFRISLLNGLENHNIEIVKFTIPNIIFDNDLQYENRMYNGNNLLYKIILYEKIITIRYLFRFCTNIHVNNNYLYKFTNPYVGANWVESKIKFIKRKINSPYVQHKPYRKLHIK